jgi:hypothetical protein
MYVSNAMKVSKKFNQMLSERGYSTKAIEEMWKWYDCSSRGLLGGEKEELLRNS